MRIRVLGSAAGGGLPQWNCACANCRAARAGDPHVRPRTQESVAFSSDGDRWFLVNASPDIARQIESFPPLTPRGLRETPIAGILLTSGDVDHCLGLLSLREDQPLSVWATDRVRAGLLEGNVLFRTLQRFPEQVVWRGLPLGAEVALDAGLAATAIPSPGKPPIHLQGLDRIAPHDPAENVGLVVRDTVTGRRLAYFSSVASISREVLEACADADLVFFDGTFWSSDELLAQGIGRKRAEEMAHHRISGEGGSLAVLSGLGSRRVFIHVNNTNPILRDGSHERRAVEAAGCEVAFDGMELEL